MAKKKKKSILKSRFYRVYFVVVAVALIAIAIGTLWLRGVLADYESAQPVYVAEDVAKLFEDGDYQRIYDLDTSAAQISDGDKAFYLESMAEISSGKKVEWSEAFSTDDDIRKYNVTLDGDRFATFTLVPSGQKTRRGNRLWKLGDVTTLVTRKEPDPTPEPTPTPEPDAEPTPTPEPEILYECRVTVPQGYAVIVDGVTLDESNAQVAAGSLFEDGFLPEGVENPATTVYVYSSKNERPTVEVKDETGAQATPIPDAEKERVWTCRFKEDEALKEQYGKAAYGLGQKLAKFMSKDGSKKSITKLCLKKSPAWTIFENLDNDFATPHSGNDFRNPDVTEFYRLSDTCFTCRVSFDYVLYTKDGERVFPTAYTFCLVSKGGKGGLYNLQIY